MNLNFSTTKHGETVHDGDVVEYEIPPMRGLFVGEITLFDNVLFVQKNNTMTPLNRCKIKRKLEN